MTLRNFEFDLEKLIFLVRTEYYREKASRYRAISWTLGMLYTFRFRIPRCMPALSESISGKIPHLTNCLTRGRLSTCP